MGDAGALQRVQAHHPRYRAGFSDSLSEKFTLADAQLVIAREYGFSSWPQYRQALRVLMRSQNLFTEAVQAIITGDAAQLKSLLADHPELVSTRSTHENQATLLHYVSANRVEDEYQKTPPNAAEIAEILLQAGADPNATASFYGGGAASTPLVCLVSSAHPYEAGVQASLVDVFVRHGAKVDGIDDDSLPAVTALEHWYPLAFAALVAAGARLDNPVLAAAAGRVDLLATMLDSDTLSPYRDTAGHTISNPDSIRALAFVKACLCGQVEVIRYLHGRGLDVNVTVDHQRTGLHEAAWAGQLAVVDDLLAEGADASISDEQFHSMPVQWAYVRGHTQVFERLLPHSPLSIEIAVQFGLVDQVTRMLDDDPALANGRASDGVPLRAAVAYRHVDLIRLLLARGADPALANAQGMTALDLARRMGQQGVVELLENHQTH